MSSIRHAVAGDAALLANLNRFVHALHRDRRPDQFRSPTSRELTDWYQSQLGEPSTNGWIAEDGGTPVGYLLARHYRRSVTPFAPAREWYEIDQLAVDPDHRRRGIGRSLVEAAVLSARERGLSHVEAASWAFNDDMHRLLDRTGFAQKVIRFERSADA